MFWRSNSGREFMVHIVAVAAVRHDQKRRDDRRRNETPSGRGGARLVADGGHALNCSRKNAMASSNVLASFGPNQPWPSPGTST